MDKGSLDLAHSIMDKKDYLEEIRVLKLQVDIYKDNIDMLLKDIKELKKELNKYKEA